MVRVPFVDISLRRIAVAISLRSTATATSSDVRAIKFQIELRKQILNDMEALHRRLKGLSRREIYRPRKAQGRSSARVASPKNGQTSRWRVETGIAKTC